MSNHSDTDLSRTWERIEQALRGLRFGSVEITVHYGRIVQIERREKLRLDTPAAGPSSTPNSASA